MNMRKLSINKACILLGTLLLLAVGAVCTAVYLLTRNITAVQCMFLFSLFVLLCVISFVALIRRKLVRFSDAFCGQMDDMILSRLVDTFFSRISLTMQLSPKHHNTVYVLPWEEDLH